MRKHIPLIVICLGYLMVIVDATIVNVALPAIERDLHGSVSDLQWVVDAYTVVFAGLLLAAGSAGDRLGARRVFSVGLAVFTVASAACAASPSVSLLIAARVIQGIGAAILVPASLALLRATYDDDSDRARAVGIWGGVAGVGAATGPILGGALVTLISWRAIFVVNLPLGALGLALAPGRLAGAAPGRTGSFDPAGQILGMLGLGGLTFGLIEGGAAGWSSPQTWVPILAAALAAWLLILAERRTRDPMLPLGLFKRPTFSGATFVGLAINLGFYGQLFALSLYFQHARGFSALETGLALLPEGIFVAAASLLSGRLTGRLGPRRPMLIGLLCGAAGLAGLVAAGSSTPYAVLVAPLVATGFGMALTMPAATSAVIASAPGERAGIAAGVLNASRQAGGAIGVALLGTLIAGNELVSGTRVAMAVAAGAFLTGALVAAIFVERPPGNRRSVRHHGRR